MNAREESNVTYSKPSRLVKYAYIAALHVYSSLVFYRGQQKCDISNKP